MPNRFSLHRHFYTCLLFVFSLSSAAAGDGFVFSPTACDAYQFTFSLRFDEARASLQRLRQQEPDNLIEPFLENYLDFLTVLISDNRAEYTRLSKNMDARLDRIASGDARSPYFLYTQAEMHLQWGILRARYGDYLRCLGEIKQAYSLLTENRRRHPGFLANYKSLGILHALIGNVPEEYRWAVKLLGGMSGTVDQGMQELQGALADAEQHGSVFEGETRIAYALLQLHLANDKTAAWQTLNAGRLDPRANPLAAFALANMALRTGRNDEAIRILQSCPRNAPYQPLPYLDYLLGTALLNRLDPDADRPFKAFLQAFHGESNIKEAYQKLAWHQLINNEPRGYQTYMALVKTQGGDRTEPDKVALREARSGEMPDARLVRARLLFDGGYYQQAYDLLKNAAGDYAQAGKSNLEYTYRLGRVAHELQQSPDAIRLYRQTIESGARQPWYFACNAALQLGMLYEQLGNKSEARQAFRRCLDIQPEEYAATLHARAKAGLARVRG